MTTMTGTQTGPLDELPVNGKSFTMTNIIIYRFEKGKITETRIGWDNVDMLMQLGIIPPRRRKIHKSLAADIGRESYSRP